MEYYGKEVFTHTIELSNKDSDYIRKKIIYLVQKKDAKIIYFNIFQF